MKRPAALCGFTVFFVLICLSGCDIIAAAVGLSLFAVGFIVSILGLIFSGAKSLRIFTCIFAVTLSGLFAVGVYTLKYISDYRPSVAFATRDEAQISGTVYDKIGFSDGKHSYILKLSCVDGVPADCKLMISSYKDLYLMPGDSVEGTVSSIYASSDGRSAAYYMSEGVYLFSDGVLELHSEGSSTRGLYTGFARIRLWLKENIMRAAGGDEGGVLCGMVLGDVSGISARAENSFTGCGINHIFAVSGFHVSAWSMLIFILLDMLGVGKIPKAVISSVFVFVVCAVTGFPLSGLRAAFMLTVIYFSGCFRLDGDMLNSLGLALIVICSLNPFAGGSSSLLLSVAATVGIAIYSEFIQPEIKEFFGRKIKSDKLLSLAVITASPLLLGMTVSIVTSPLLIIMFGRISLVSPLSNLILVPITEIAMMTGGLSALLNFRFGIKTAAEICRLLLIGADKIASAPLSVSEINIYEAVGAFIAAGLLCLILKAAVKRKKFATLFICTAYICILCFSGVGVFANANKLTVDIINSGGVSVLLRQSGRSILITESDADNALVGSISERCIYNLDLILLCGDEEPTVLKETFSPSETVLKAGNYSAVYDGGLKIYSADSRAGYIFEFGGKTAAVVFDEMTSEALPETDILICRYPPPDGELAGKYEKVYVCADGEDSADIDFIKKHDEHEFCLKRGGF